MNLFEVDRINENSKGKIIWRQEQIDYIIREYQNNSSIKKLSIEFKVHTNSIKKVLQENEIHIRNLQESRKNNQIRSDVFKNIDTDEKAYWLGFLAADGNVYQTKISCNLQINDKAHLKKLNSFLGNAYEVKTYKDKKTNREYCSLSYFSSEMANDLRRHGVVDRKSLILEPPIFIKDQKLKLAWIRGYFDGDGGLSFSKTQRRAQFYFTSTYSVLKWINKVLELNRKPFLEHNCENTYRISYNGWNIAKSKLELLYKDAPVYLNRKYYLFLKLYEPSERELLKTSFLKEANLWINSHQKLILSCKKNNIINELKELFDIGKKYNFTDRRSVANAICNSSSTKQMLTYLQSLLQQ